MERKDEILAQMKELSREKLFGHPANDRKLDIQVQLGELAAELRGINQENGTEVVSELRPASTRNHEFADEMAKKGIIFGKE